ncbi:MAG: AAA family ATPase [Proteobacteria bacterium]|jgi:predicted ATPase|nr:AAA family ATPase [Pseudomonadota bacterium]
MLKMNRIHIQGFRRLMDVDIEMRPIMVLLGANGVGKSSLLDAFSLLSASAGGKLNGTLNGMGGLASLSTRDRARSISFQLSMSVPNDEPLDYALELSPKETGYSISRETLTQARQGYEQPFKHIDSVDGDIKYYKVDGKGLVRPDWEHSPLETSLFQVPKMFKYPEELRRLMASATKYHVLDVGPRAPVKTPQQMKPAILPGADGEDLVPYLYYLRESDPDRYEAIEDTLKAAFGEFDALGFPPVAAGMLAMTWKDKSFGKPFYAHELSEGTLRFLWLVALLQSPGLSTVTMIDEPEVSLHPEQLSIIAEVMREASARTQLVVATHSDRLVRFLKPEEVVVMDVCEDGSATARWADSMDLDGWLEDYGLDEVWRMGRMGGRS